MGIEILLERPGEGVKRLVAACKKFERRFNEATVKGEEVTLRLIVSLKERKITVAEMHDQEKFV
jgi:hypothetical protein